MAATHLLSACSLSEPPQHLLWTEGGVHSDEFVSGPGALETNEGRIKTSLHQDRFCNGGQIYVMTVKKSAGMNADMFQNLVKRYVAFLQAENFSQVAYKLRVGFSICRRRCDGNSHRLCRNLCRSRRRKALLQ